MLSLLAGLYPPLPGDDATRLRSVVADQREAGLGVVADGRIHDPRTEGAAEVAAALDALVAARDAETDAAPGSEPAEEPPLPAIALLGPLSSGAEPDVVRAAIAAAVGAGAGIVVLHEPFLLTPAAAAEGERARAVAAWCAALDGIAGHVMLAAPGGGIAPVGAETLAAAPFSSHYLDLVHGPEDWRLAALLPPERGLVLGVADPRTERPESTAVLLWAARYAASLGGRGPARVGLAPAGGFAALPRDVARGKLRLLAATVRLAALPPEEAARRIDPRAVNARSAALGRVEPAPRPRRAPEAGEEPVT